MTNARVFLALMLSPVVGTLITGIAAAETARAAGEVMSVAGPVVVARTDVVPRPLRFRDNLYWRDVVEARKDGIARVLLGGKAAVTVRELSRLELREEKRAEGVRYVADLVSGKIRASVARMLMRPGDRVEVWTFNTVASVRGTDFIVETVERPAQPGAFGLLGAREVSQGVGESAARSGETVVVTLSGAVDVTNRLAGTGRTEQIGAYEAVRVSGRRSPVRFQVSADEMKAYLSGLTPPRPQETRSADRSDAVGNRVERVSHAASARALGPASSHGGRGGGYGHGAQDGNSSGGHDSQAGDQGNGDAGGNGSGLALGQVNGGGNGKGLGLGNANLANNVGKGKGKK